MTTDFVEDWAIAQTLGEGAYGEVKLLVNKHNGEMVAMKIIDLEKNPSAKECVRKEVTVHRMLQDQHIIRFFGRRQHENIEYIFLEYAPNGELFDRIEPDVGMSQWEAQKYMRQLISGVEYLHSRGVAHRDLKPENLLLDAQDNLKITDFGLATVFRIGGKERSLDKKCGTLPYVAPEVLSRPYAAEPADIWSCGIVLCAMLAGELPWDKAESDCREFLAWRSGKYMQLSPWSKIDNLSLSLLKRILSPLPSARYTIEAIKSHRWFVKPLKKSVDKVPFAYEENGQVIKTENDKNQSNDSGKKSSVSDNEGDRPVKRLHSDQRDFCPEHENLASHSQPVLSRQDSALDGLVGEGGEIVAFSQPTHLHDMLISTQQLNTQSTSTKNSLQKLVRRMTRFFVKLSIEDSMTELTNALEVLNLSWASASSSVTITTIDRRKSMLVFKANVLDMDKQTLLDFRLSKGCGLEFKKYFVSIKSLMSEFVVNGPITWSIAMSSQPIP